MHLARRVGAAITEFTGILPRNECLQCAALRLHGSSLPIHVSVLLLLRMLHAHVSSSFAFTPDINHSTQKHVLTRGSFHRKIEKRSVQHMHAHWHARRVSASCVLAVTKKRARAHAHARSTGVMIQLRGCFHRIGLDQPSKDPCLHLHVIGVYVSSVMQDQRRRTCHVVCASKCERTSAHTRHTHSTHETRTQDTHTHTHSQITGHRQT